MPDIVLATLNSKYAHCSLALRYLYANLGDLQARAEMQEYLWSERACDVAEKILASEPRIVGLGVYIWNATESLELVRILKAVQPELVVVLGGPEVRYEVERQEVCDLADYVITGEGELALATLCREILDQGTRPDTKVIEGGLPELAELASPYPFYNEVDIAKRTIYVEASRGCPFKCEFCLSSLDIAVRQFPEERFFADMQALIDKGARQFKFIDRTFNLKPRLSIAILEFFLNQMELGLFLHFEMVPDRLPTLLRDTVVRFPPGSIQFEVGIQTFDDATSKRISRRQDLVKLEDNLRFLHRETNVHVHADLIIGLPGEDEQSFARGFDRLVSMGPHEVQVGILKRLRGTPIIRHDAEYQMVYSQSPPYEILQNRELPFADLARLKRFARAWDLVANRGNFNESTKLLWAGTTPFVGFMAFSEWLYDRVGHFTGIALDKLVAFILEYLSEHAVQCIAPSEAAKVLVRDYSRPRLPSFLAELAGESTSFRAISDKSPTATPKRQARHL